MVTEHTPIYSADPTRGPAAQETTSPHWGWPHGAGTSGRDTNSTGKPTTDASFLSKEMPDTMWEKTGNQVAQRGHMTPQTTPGTRRPHTVEGHAEKCEPESRLPGVSVGVPTSRNRGGRRVPAPPPRGEPELQPEPLTVGSESSRDDVPSVRRAIHPLVSLGSSYTQRPIYQN